MASGKFKLGDRVKVVNFGGKGFRENLLGKVGRIVDTRPHSNPWDYGVEFDEYDHFNHSCGGKGKQGYCFWGMANQLALVEDNTSKIVIIVDGCKTIARIYDGNKVIKEAVATCSPEDEFDFETGAKLAFERLELKNKEDEKVEEVKKTLKFNDGDRARIVKCEVGHRFPIGTIVTLKKGTIDYLATDSEGNEWWVIDKELSPLTFKPGDKVKIIGNSCFHGYNNDDIVTLTEDIGCLSFKPGTRWRVEEGDTWVTECDIEPYIEPEEPTYFKGKAICVADITDTLTVGKVYDFSINDGCGKNDCGSRIVNHSKHTIGDINNAFMSGGVKFIPYVEDDAPKTKYYNGKVVCVDNRELAMYSKGKVYQFIEGFMCADNNDTYPEASRRIRTFHDWEEYSMAKWIEFKE